MPKPYLRPSAGAGKIYVSLLWYKIVNIFIIKDVWMMKMVPLHRLFLASAQFSWLHWCSTEKLSVVRGEDVNVAMEWLRAKLSFAVLKKAWYEKDEN